jgi:F0F1-type ATP synthase assembly protein I
VAGSGGGRFGSSGPDAAKGLSLAFEFAGAVFLFWFLGRLVDNWLDIEPWGQVVGALIGWVGGFLHVYYATQRRG